MLKTFLHLISKEFWKFSWDEMAHYDLPETLEYVLEETGKVYNSIGAPCYFTRNLDFK
jgi:hypothetical protein